MIDISGRNSWLRFWPARPQARLRLFCFPYAGGSNSTFRTWSAFLPLEVEVCPVQLPGREERFLEEPFSHLPSLVACLGQALLPYLDRPYAFFGHSMGALISFELVRYLRRIPHFPAPVHLYVASHRAPQLPDPDAPTYDLPDAEFVAELRRLKGTPEEVLQNSELLLFLLPLLRADFALCETYLYTEELPVACPITAFGGLLDTEVSPDQMNAWSKQTTGAFRLHLFAGDHFFLHQEQVALLEVLSLNLIKDLQSLKAAN